MCKEGKPHTQGPAWLVAVLGFTPDLALPGTRPCPRWETRTAGPGTAECLWT